MHKQEVERKRERGRDVFLVGESLHLGDAGWLEDFLRPIPQ
jgi:hypothetical protein